MKITLRSYWMVISVVVTVGFSMAAVGRVGASGFRIIDQSAVATSQVDVFVAQADEPSALYYNPAGLTQLSGTQVEIGVNMFILRTEHTSPSGVKEDMQKREHFPLFGYVVSDLGTEKWRFGIGVNSPFGLANDWSDTGFSRYVATHTALKTVNVNPTIAYRLFPQLSVAVGLDYLYADQEMKRQINYGALIGQPGNTALDGTFSGDADGNGWGYNLGVLIQPHPQHGFGLAFRSKIDVSFRGDAKIYHIPPGFPGFPRMKSAASSNLRFPPYLTVGYAFRPTEKWKIEFDIDWTRWSTYDELVIRFDNPFLPTQMIEKDWKDTLTYALGVEYRVDTNWTVRGGGGYMESPIPESTFDTTVARPDQCAFSLGGGYQTGQLKLDLGYLFAFGDKDISNNVGAEVGADLDGKYKIVNQVIALSGGYTF